MLSLVENRSTCVIGHPVIPFTRPVRVKSKSPEEGGERPELEVKILAKGRSHESGFLHSMMIFSS